VTHHRVKKNERPWVLEVWDLADDKMDWVTWSTCKAEKNACDIRDRLLSRGHRARVRNSATGVVICPHCGDGHSGLFDGSCLL
jgi:fatty acid-binding protein DegV